MPTKTARPEVHTTEIDGVPCMWSPAPGPLRACLVFGVGRVDETLATAGVTHAVEHLTLHAQGDAPGGWNGSVDLTHTRFHVEGTAANVTAFFDRIGAALAEPAMDRLDDELRVLRVEEERRQWSLLGLDLALRYGATGPGLLNHPEYGLRRLRADDIRAWVATKFVRGAAALWLTGPPPKRLRVNLPDGDRQDAAAPSRLGWAGPAWFGSNSRLVSASVVAAPQPGRGTAFAAITSRAFAELRTDMAASYAIERTRVDLGDGDQLDAVSADCAAGYEAEVRDRMVKIINEVAADGPTTAEVARERKQWLQGIDDERMIIGQLDGTAQAVCRGREAPSLEVVIDQVNALTPTACANAVAGVIDTTLMIGPRVVTDPPDGYAAYPAWSDCSVTGQRYRPVANREHGELIVGGSGLTWELDNRRRRTVTFADCVALCRWDNGRREITARDGTRIVVVPLHWWDADRLDTTLDLAVDPDLHIDMGPGDPIAPRPAKPRRRISLRNRLVIALGLMTVLLGVLLLQGASRPASQSSQTTIDPSAQAPPPTDTPKNGGWVLVFGVGALGVGAVSELRARRRPTRPS